MTKILTFTRMTQEDIHVNALQITSIEKYRRSMFNPMDNVGCRVRLSDGQDFHVLEDYQDTLKMWKAALDG